MPAAVQAGVFQPPTSPAAPPDLGWCAGERRAGWQPSSPLTASTGQARCASPAAPAQQLRPPSAALPGPPPAAPPPELPRWTSPAESSCPQEPGRSPHPEARLRSPRSLRSLWGFPAPSSWLLPAEAWWAGLSQPPGQQASARQLHHLCYMCTAATRNRAFARRFAGWQSTGPRQAHVL